MQSRAHLYALHLPVADEVPRKGMAEAPDTHLGVRTTLRNVFHSICFESKVPQNLSGDITHQIVFRKPLVNLGLIQRPLPNTIHQFEGRVDPPRSAFFDDVFVMVAMPRAMILGSPIALFTQDLDSLLEQLLAHPEDHALDEEADVFSVGLEMKDRVFLLVSQKQVGDVVFGLELLAWVRFEDIAHAYQGGEKALQAEAQTKQGFLVVLAAFSHVLLA